jgi:hypothetical protein
MNPGFYVDLSSYQAGRCFIDLIYTSGASGAVPSPLGNFAFGITSVTRTGTGLFTIVFDGQASALLNYTLNNHQATYSASGACFVQVTGVTLSTRTITIQTVTAAGAAVDPASGDILHMTFQFQLYGN